MNKYKFTPSSAEKMIIRAGGKVGGNRAINITDPGIKVLGAIDFLVNYHHYTWNK